MQVKAFREQGEYIKHKGALRRREKQTVAVCWGAWWGIRLLEASFAGLKSCHACSPRSGLGFIQMMLAEKAWLKLRAGAEGCGPKGTKETGLTGLGDQLTDYGKRHSFVCCFLKLPSSAKWISSAGQIWGFHKLRKVRAPGTDTCAPTSSKHEGNTQEGPTLSDSRYDSMSKCVSKEGTSQLPVGAPQATS